MTIERPRARPGLVTSDHTRRGRRVVTVLDPETLRVCVLDPWEHAALVLCDGARSAEQILALLPDVDDVSIDLAQVRACLALFEREGIVESPAVAAPRFASVGPRTLAGLQSAYQEWHKDPVRTKQILLGADGMPFVDQAPAPGLSPTVALPDDDRPAHRVGSVLVAADDDDRSSTEEMDGAPPSVLYGDEPDDPERTDVGTPLPLPHGAAAVFARLRRAGVVARTDPESKDPRGEGRRKNRATTAVFDTGLELLKAGDLAFALDHFRALAERMPGSDRVILFVQAIEAVRRQPAFDTAPIADPERQARARQMLASFEGAIADAVNRGQCPSCFGIVSENDELCGRCQFVLRPDDV